MYNSFYGALLLEDVGLNKGRMKYFPIYPEIKYPIKP